MIINCIWRRQRAQTQHCHARPPHKTTQHNNNTTTTHDDKQALAHLYRTQGRPDLSLAILLRLRLPSVFGFAREHALAAFLAGRAPLLMDVDERQALDLLVASLDAVPPGDVVPS